MHKISKILKNRDCESDFPKWEELIGGFPDAPNFDLGTSYTNIFYQLASGYGGPVQVMNDGTCYFSPCSFFQLLYLLFDLVSHLIRKG